MTGPALDVMDTELDVMDTELDVLTMVCDELLCARADTTSARRILSAQSLKLSGTVIVDASS